MPRGKIFRDHVLLGAITGKGGRTGAGRSVIEEVNPIGGGANREGIAIAPTRQKI